MSPYHPRSPFGVVGWLRPIKEFHWRRIRGRNWPKQTYAAQRRGLTARARLVDIIGYISAEKLSENIGTNLTKYTLKIFQAIHSNAKFK